MRLPRISPDATDRDLLLVGVAVTVMGALFAVACVMLLVWWLT